MDGNGDVPTTPGGSPVAKIGDCLMVRDGCLVIFRNSLGAC